MFFVFFVFLKPYCYGEPFVHKLDRLTSPAVHPRRLRVPPVPARVQPKVSAGQVHLHLRGPEEGQLRPGAGRRGFPPQAQPHLPHHLLPAARGLRLRQPVGTDRAHPEPVRRRARALVRRHNPEEHEHSGGLLGPRQQGGPQVKFTQGAKDAP